MSEHTFKKSYNIQTALTNKAMAMVSEAIGGRSTSNTNYVSHLPEVYSGSPNRVERYNTYEAMELDSHISASLDVIAEFCTQVDSVTKIPFVFNFGTEKPTESDSNILAKMLRTWCNTNDFDNQIFDIVRDVLKYGDAFFIRDPETLQWLRIYHGNVEKVIVNEAKGKSPEQYIIKDLDYNFQNLSVSQLPQNYQGNLPSIPASTFNSVTQNTRNTTVGQSQSRFNNGMGASAVDAAHVIHVNMTKRGDTNWPFGTSILERVFKTYKQKELIEDAILIYRLQRAPQRRIFYVDVGDLPEHKAMAFIEQVKNSVSQRRIPSKTGGGANIMDASYNPISMLDDFFFPQKPDGRGSRIETLPGGETSWGIDELQYFDNKLARGLRVPSSYLPTGPDDSPATFNDGKVGAALIQEFRFAEMCKRIQRAISKKFDEEFKLYLKRRDINIDSSTFNLGFVEPQSFVTYRDIELNTSRLSNFNSAVQNPFFSKRWAMLKFLGLTPDEINQNHEMLMAENPSKYEKISNINNLMGKDSPPVDLRSVGFSSADFADQEEPGTQEENNPTEAEPQAQLGGTTGQNSGETPPAPQVGPV